MLWCPEVHTCLAVACKHHYCTVWAYCQSIFFSYYIVAQIWSLYTNVIHKTPRFVSHKLILGFTALCFLCNIMSWAVLNNTNDYNPTLQSGIDKLCWNNFKIQELCCE